jgi:hypothetical protein
MRPHLVRTEPKPARPAPWPVDAVFWVTMILLLALVGGGRLA